MGLSDYNLSGEQKQNIAHLASIVKIALADGIISEDEEKLLKKIAKKFHILEDKYDEIINSPDAYPINAPHGYDERIEKLYELSKMVNADGKISLDEISLLHKICIGLAFPIQNIEKIVNESVRLVSNDCDLDDFTIGIKKINKN